MSRTAWYRLGKPSQKPTPRMTQAHAAKSMGVALRSIQRAGFVARHDSGAFAQMKAGALRTGTAERRIHAAQGRDIATITIRLGVEQKQVLSEIAGVLDCTLGDFAIIAINEWLARRGLGRFSLE